MRSTLALLLLFIPTLALAQMYHPTTDVWDFKNGLMIRGVPHDTDGPSSGGCSSSVTPGNYTNANITIDANGCITAAANGTPGTGGCAGVTPGSYTNANITVNANGCVTAASSGIAGSSTLPFNDLTAGTVLSQALRVGNGATLAPTGTGILTANALTGALVVPSGSSVAPASGASVVANGITGTPTVGSGVTLGPAGTGVLTANALSGAITLPSGSSVTPASGASVTATELIGTPTIGTGETLGPTGTGVLTANALTGAVVVPSGVSVAPTGTGTVTANGLTGAIVVPSGSSVSATGTGSITATAITGIADPSTILTTTNVKKVSGKQFVPRVVAATVVSNVATANCDTTDIATYDAIPADFTVALPICTGTNPEPEQELEYRFSSTTPRLITWNAAFCEDNHLLKPTATSGLAGKYDHIKFRRNSIDNCWGVIATTFGLTKGVTTLGNSTTFTCNYQIASRCEMQMTGAAGTVTIDDALMLTPTPTNGDMVWLALQCTNLQALTWDAGFLDGINQTKPTSCPANTNTWLEVLVRYSSVENGWVVLVGDVPAVVNLTAKTLRVPNSTTRPATCTVGDAYMDTDATTGQRWYLCETANTWVVQGAGGAGATFTVTKNIPVTGVKFPATDPARLDRSGNTDKLLFDATVSQCVSWQFMWPTDWTSGGTIKLNGSMASAITGSVFYNFAVWKLTPGAAVDVDTLSYDTTNTCNTTTVPGTAGFPFTVSCALTNKDGAVAGDNIVLKMCRDVADTASGDGEVEVIELAYVH